MRTCLFHYKAALAAAVFLVSCAPPGDDGADFTFAVLDVGQGLSQIGAVGDRCVVWDMGPRAARARWADGYARTGAPGIEAVVISHTDEDHLGGLGALDSCADFTGLVAVSPFADTAFIRTGAGAWAGRLAFRIVAQGDTLACLPGTRIECLWPPRDSAGLGGDGPDVVRNRLSLVFRVETGATACLVTSDADSTALRVIARTVRQGLRCDVMVVAHHGSASSVCPEFYGYAAPAHAVISCAMPNPYGHPSQELLDLLFQLGVTPASTYESGTVTLVSNGYYYR